MGITPLNRHSAVEIIDQIKKESDWMIQVNYLDQPLARVRTISFPHSQHLKVFGIQEETTFGLILLNENARCFFNTIIAKSMNHELTCYQSSQGP